MDIDVTKDIGFEPLTITFVAGQPAQTQTLSVFELADKFYTLYGTKDAYPDQAIPDAEVRKVFEAYGYAPPAVYGACHVTANVIMRAVQDRKKKFEATLWGESAAPPAVPPSTAVIPEDISAFLPGSSKPSTT